MNPREHIHAWLTMKYKKERDKRNNIANKSHGSDGIHGESYKTLRKPLANPITEIANNIPQWSELPSEWKEGAIVHIYNQKKAKRINESTIGPFV